MATPSTNNPSYARVLAYLDAYYEAHFDRVAVEPIDNLHASLANVTIDFDQGDVASYRCVQVTDAPRMVGCNGSLECSFSSGDVIEDFNRASQLLDILGMKGCFSDSVQSFVNASVHGCAVHRRGVAMDWQTDGGPVLRAAWPHEYRSQWDDFEQ